MPYSKEHSLSNQNLETEEIALKEVDSYIEKIERQTETTTPDSNNKNNSVPDNTSLTRPGNQIPVSISKKDEPIILPLTQKSLELGLKDKPNSGFKWLAEWCFMMMRKYPGRVFYSSNDVYD